MLQREEIKRNIDNFIKAKEQALIKLKKANLPIPDKPQNSETLFQEWEELKRKYGGVAEIPYHILGDFLDKWASMLAYARWAEANAEINMITSREIRDTVKKQLYNLQDGGREAKDAAVYCESIYLEWERKYLEDLTLYTMIQALREGYEQKIAAISREITRRTDEFKDNRRSINVFERRW